MPVPPVPPLAETITPGQTDHVADHEAIADALNNDTMSLTGAQAVAGVKDFTGSEGLKYKGGTVARVKEGPLSLLDPRVDADPTGVTAINTAFAAALALIPSGGGELFGPPGVYKTTAKLVIDSRRGIRFSGASKRATTIRPTAALGANPTIQLCDHRDITIENMTVEGADTNTTACIESRRVAASPTWNCRGAVIQGVRLGADSPDNMQIGYLTSAAGGADTNNDYHDLIDVEVANHTVAGMSFEHYNSLHHNIIAPRITNGPCGIRNGPDGGGTWSLHGGVFESIDDYLFDLRGTANTTHPFVMEGFTSEVAGGLIRSAAGAANALLGRFGFYGAPSGDIVDWNAVSAGNAGGFISISDAWMLTGQPATVLRFAEPTSRARVSNCILGITDIEWEGDLYWEANTPLSSQTFTPGAAATLHAGGDSSGPYKQGTFTTHPSFNDVAVGARVAGDAFDRIQMYPGGMILGPGSGALDTIFGRGGTSFMYMPILIKAGVPSDADFVFAPPNGTFAWNQLTNKMHCRIGSVWTAHS